jgi:hypothetical protein
MVTDATVSADRGVIFECVCRDGLVPDPASVTRCVDPQYPTMPPVPSPLPTPGHPIAPTNYPTEQPTWETCADGNHGCDPSSSMCAVIQLHGAVGFECDCLAGFVKDPMDMQACLPVTVAPSISPTVDSSLQTPAPTPVLLETRSTKCNSSTTTNQHFPFCKLPDRNRSFWLVPGTQTAAEVRTRVE